MFCDLVGSTALSARMDPEDLREVISAYQKCVAETVERFGGFVAKYMGDGVLVYFGYPQAHEDDAERAVRAGLKLVGVVRDLKTHTALQTRVGIATGLVVVGDLIGSGASQEQAIVGETPNLAARLQSIAEPNTVVIADSTRRLIGNLFELEDLGSKDLKGIVGPVRGWAAPRPALVESRFEALHADGLTELIGREEELELDRVDYAAEFDHNGIAGVRFFCDAGARIDLIAAQRAQPCWGAVVGGARAVLRSISRTRRGNGLDQSLAETEIEQLDVRIDAEL